MNSKKQRKMTLSTAKVSCVLSVTLLMGCASTGPSQYESLQLTKVEQQDIKSQPAYLQVNYNKLYQEGRRNEVLNRVEIGTKAFARGDIDIARTNFDLALAQIETVYANNESAHKARSLWYEEGQKDFKGEPYERAMAYYYRGLIYLAEGEFGNARASFLSALMQDAFAEDEQNSSDFASMLFLAGWSAQQMGNVQLAQQAYDEYKMLRPESPVPQASDNVLVIAETGKSPRKLADGLGHYELVFRRGKNFNDVFASYNQQLLTPLSDVYWQATSRGGRPVDAIVEGKARFKQFNEEMGDTLADLGVATRVWSPALGGDTAQISNILTLAGVAQMAIGANAKPRADTRYWSNLPDKIHGHTFGVQNPSELGRLEFVSKNDQGAKVTTKGQQQHVYESSNDSYFIWYSAHER